VSRDYPHRGLGHRRLEEEVIRIHERQSAENIGTIHLRRTGGKDQGDLMNSGVRRLKAQALGVPSHEW
jgi:hypothetical protein